MHSTFIQTFISAAPSRMPYTHSTAAASTLSSESESSLSPSPATLSRHHSTGYDVSQLQMGPADARSHSSLGVSQDSGSQSQSSSPMASSAHVNRNTVDNTGPVAPDRSLSRSRGRHPSIAPLSSPANSRTPRSISISSNVQNMGIITPDNSTFGHSDSNREVSMADVS